MRTADAIVHICEMERVSGNVSDNGRVAVRIGVGTGSPMDYPDVFVHLRSAVLRGNRNYHRLEHLGRNRDTANARGRPYSLAEETITDLLIADMAGVAYDVAGPCPDCSPERTDCAHWSGVAQFSETRLMIQPLTKAEEGGNRRRRAVGADFVMTFNSSAAGNPTAIRLLMQAKRAVPSHAILTTAAEERQFQQLIASASEYGAVPYYALYVQHPDAHRVSVTRCSYSTSSAADTAIVLTPALDGPTDLRLLRAQVEVAIAAGRPLLCMTGCECCGSQDMATSFDAARAFIHQDFPNYRPKDELRPPPAGLAAVSINDDRVAVTEAPNQSPRRATTARDDREILIVRLGVIRKGLDGSRIGYSPTMTPEEIKDSASRWWVLSEIRVASVRHVVATFRDEVVGVYQIPSNGPIRERTSGNRSIWDLRLQDITDKRLAADLRMRAQRRVRGLQRGAQNPVIYA